MLPLKPLPLLELLSIASPCPVEWASMSGNDRTRHCSGCKQSVYNLSQLTRVEAEELIRTTEGRLCARLFRRADGTVMTADCPVGSMRLARKRLAALVSAIVIFCVALVSWVSGRPGGLRAATDRTRQIEPFRTVVDWIDPPPAIVMGGICLPPGPPIPDDLALPAEP